MGVMDYSLLIGVHTTEYDMEDQRQSHSSTDLLDDRRLQVNKVVGKSTYTSSFIVFVRFVCIPLPT